MANQFFLQAQKRNDIGKGASRRLRRADKIPAVIYGGEHEALPITISHHAILKCLNDEGFYSQIIDIEVDGEKQETILRDLQRHPYKPTILHADFQRVVRGQELHVNVPIHLVGEEKSVGLKAGGILSLLVNQIEVVCRPSLIPESLTLDISNLGMNESLRLSDIPLPNGVRLAEFEGLNAIDADHNAVVVSIHPPAAESSEEASVGDED